MRITVLCQLKWVGGKLYPGEDQIGSLLLNIEKTIGSGHTLRLYISETSFTIQILTCNY